MRTIRKKVVNAFIFSNDEQILFGKSLRGSYEGCWLTPGGGIEEGETKKEALIREVKEEIGIDISHEKIEDLPKMIRGESKKMLKDTREEVFVKYRFYNFIIRLNKTSHDLTVTGRDDFSDATWHPLETIGVLAMPPGSVEVLRQLGYMIDNDK